MSAVSQTSDTDLLELLRMIGPTNVSELSRELDVTPTAVRQRLTRLRLRKWSDARRSAGPRPSQSPLRIDAKGAAINGVELRRFGAGAVAGDRFDRGC